MVNRARQLTGNRDATLLRCPSRESYEWNINYWKTNGEDYPDLLYPVVSRHTAGSLSNKSLPWLRNRSLPRSIERT